MLNVLPFLQTVLLGCPEQLLGRPVSFIVVKVAAFGTTPPIGGGEASVVPTIEEENDESAVDPRLFGNSDGRQISTRSDPVAGDRSG
jgi:hypothetical protein